MTDHEKQLIRSLMRGSITQIEFFAKYPLKLSNKKAISELMTSARDDRDSEALDYAMYIGDLFQLYTAETVPPLCELLLEDWHRQHEYIARLLQRFRSPDSIDALYKVATKKLEYLAYDDSHALARKCIWALGDIGTVDARRKLELLADSQDVEVARLAKHRLDLDLGPVPGRVSVRSPIIFRPNEG